MKKKAFLRGLLGFPLGIAIGHVISVICSLLFGDGTFQPCTSELIALAGNEVNAIILQTFFCGIVGTGFAASSVVWEKETWSIAKQTGSYFLINSLIMLPVAYFLQWMEHSLKGFLIYFGLFTFYFGIMWVIQYFIWKHTLKKMNKRLSDMINDK